MTDEPLARITNYNDLVVALRAAKELRGLSDKALERRAFMGEGHVNKILGPTRVKGIGSSVLETLMDALCVDFLMVSSPEKLAKWNDDEFHRQESRVRDNHPVAKTAVSRVQRANGERTMAALKASGRLREHQSKAAKARWANTTPEQRSQAALYRNMFRWGRGVPRPGPEK